MEKYLTEEQDELIMDLILKETQEAAYIEQCLIESESLNEN